MAAASCPVIFILCAIDHPENHPEDDDERHNVLQLTIGITSSQLRPDIRKKQRRMHTPDNDVKRHRIRRPSRFPLVAERVLLIYWSARECTKRIGFLLDPFVPLWLDSLFNHSQPTRCFRPYR